MNIVLTVLPLFTIYNKPQFAVKSRQKKIRRPQNFFDIYIENIQKKSQTCGIFRKKVEPSTFMLRIITDVKALPVSC